MPVRDVLAPAVLSLGRFGAVFYVFCCILQIIYDYKKGNDSDNFDYVYHYDYHFNYNYKYDLL